MSRYGTAEVLLDEMEIEYLLDLVELNQKVGGALISVEVQGALAEALEKAQENRA